MQQTAQAYQKYIRQTPRKLRLLADLVRGMPVNEAQIQLKVAGKRAGLTLLKVVNAAKANAVNTLSLEASSLKIKSILVEEGPTFKRWRPVSRGRAHPILKRSSHIKITLEGSTPQTKTETQKTANKTTKSKPKKDK